jgi:hypothetical protein
VVCGPPPVSFAGLDMLESRGVLPLEAGLTDMPIKRLIENNPVLRYRCILAVWKLAKVQRWAAGHPAG